MPITELLNPSLFLFLFLSKQYQQRVVAFYVIIIPAIRKWKMSQGIGSQMFSLSDSNTGYHIKSGGKNAAFKILLS